MVHTRGHVLRLAYLVGIDDAAIEDLESEYSKAIRVNSGERMALDCLPARFRYLRRRITTAIRDDASIPLLSLVLLIRPDRKEGHQHR